MAWPDIRTLWYLRKIIKHCCSKYLRFRIEMPLKCQVQCFVIIVSIWQDKLVCQEFKEFVVVHTVIRATDFDGDGDDEMNGAPICLPSVSGQFGRICVGYCIIFDHLNTSFFVSCPFCFLSITVSWCNQFMSTSVTSI